MSGRKRPKTAIRTAPKQTDARMARTLPIVDLQVPAMPPNMTPSMANPTERKPVSGQPNVLKLGLAVTAIHVLFLLLLLGKAF